MRTKRSTGTGLPTLPALPITTGGASFLNQREMLQIVQEQLAVDLSCSVADLNGDTDSFVFVLAKDNPGRRPFPRSEQHFDMLTMGRAIIVSATAALMPLVKPQIEGKSRDDAFFLPFVYGHSVYFLPNLERLQRLPEVSGYSYAHPRPDGLALIARKGDLVVAMSGASVDCATMWQVGVDVLREYRGAGLAAYLVNRLTWEVLQRGFIPYYGTASSNVPSQRVAGRAGYVLTWMSAYRGQFAGIDTLPTG